MESILNFLKIASNVFYGFCVILVIAVIIVVLFKIINSWVRQKKSNNMPGDDRQKSTQMVEIIIEKDPLLFQSKINKFLNNPDHLYCDVQFIPTARLYNLNQCVIHYQVHIDEDKQTADSKCPCLPCRKDTHAAFSNSEGVICNGLILYEDDNCILVKDEYNNRYYSEFCLTIGRVGYYSLD